MKRKLSVLLTGLTVVLYFCFLRDHIPTHTPEVKTENRKLSQIFQGPRTQFVQSPPLISAHPGCNALWQALRKMDLGRLRSSASFEKLPDSENCRHLPGVFRNFLQRYHDTCQPFFNGVLRSAKTARRDEVFDCFSSLTIFRALISKWLYRDKKLAEISDLGVLTDLLFTNGLHEDGSIHFDEDGEAPIVERMMQLYPASYELKAYLFNVRLGEAMRNKDNDPQKATAALKEMGDLLKDMETSGRDTQDRSDVKLFIETNGFDRERLEAKAEEMGEDTPPSGLGYYFLASVESMAGRKEDAEKYLQRAVEIEPREKRFSEAWNYFQKSGEVIAGVNSRSTSAWNILMGYDTWDGKPTAKN